MSECGRISLSLCAYLCACMRTWCVFVCVCVCVCVRARARAYCDYGGGGGDLSLANSLVSDSEKVFWGHLGKVEQDLHVKIQ